MFNVGDRVRVNTTKYDADYIQFGWTGTVTSTNPAFSRFDYIVDIDHGCSKRLIDDGNTFYYTHKDLEPEELQYNPNQQGDTDNDI